MDNLICGINPFTISRIKSRRAWRYRKHPLWYKVMKKKHPILSFFGMYEPNPFLYGFEEAEVRIYGLNGDVLLIISCRSNDRADELRDELTAQLDEFIGKLKIYEKQFL